MKDPRSRRWLFTINNPETRGMGREGLEAALNSMKLEYTCACMEIASTGTSHWQGYLVGKNQIRRSTLKAKLTGGHFEIARGTSQQNREYVRKEGRHANSAKKDTNLSETFFEIGECPTEQPGHRSDWETAVEMLKEGKSVLAVIDEMPHLAKSMTQLGRLHHLYQEQKFKRSRRQLVVTFITGETGTGKTSTILDIYGDENVFRVTNYKNPFDGYKGEAILVLDEFSSGIPMETMLNILDRYSVHLQARFEDKLAGYTRVFIISNLRLDQLYPNVQVEQPKRWAAFQRRIHYHVEFSGKAEKLIVPLNDPGRGTGPFDCNWEDEEHALIVPDSVSAAG